MRRGESTTELATGFASTRDAVESPVRLVSEEELLAVKVHDNHMSCLS